MVKRVLTMYKTGDMISLSKVYKRFSKVREGNYNALDCNKRNLYKENYILTRTYVRYTIIVNQKLETKKRKSYHGVGAP